ncbi:MAG: sigma-54 interaction domain-containing protein [Clostridia bacterium]
MEKRKRFPKIDEASLLETMLAAPDELIVVVNKNGYIENMSQAYGDFLGIQVQNAIGRHVTEVIENTRMDIVVKTGVPETGETQDIHGEKMIATRIPIRKNGMVIGAYGRVLVRNTRELHMLHDKLSSIEMELNMYKRTFEKINTAKYTVDDIIGDCSIMQDLKDSVRKVAKTNSNVLIMGESGTGKELFAHSIHAGSMRRKAPFVCVNCGSIPEQLIESELFGYEEGAFTGARKGGKIGLFPAAHGGTIFLDEIGELPLPMQVRLLRVLQDREIQRVGSNVREKVNVRVVAATNRNLYQMVKKGEFRSDLYYRLNVVTLHLPLLRERKEDLPLLIQMILSKISKKESLGAIEISREAMDHLLRYDWPGNVRELENVLERAINFTDAGEKIKAKNLPERITGSMVSRTVMPLKELMENTEKDAIKDALLRCRNCKAKAANELGISRTTLYEKMMKYEI